MTQTDRVIAAARRPQGVCQADFLLPDVCDGGPPITRVGARIQDAEEAGYAFRTGEWRQKTLVYRLVSGPPAPAAPAPGSPPTLGIDGAPNPSSPYDPWSDYA